ELRRRVAARARRPRRRIGRPASGRPRARLERRDRRRPPRSPRDPHAGRARAASRGLAGAPRRVVTSVRVVPLALVLYALLFRRRVLTWGASAAEAAESLPGDELLADADGTSTRAVTIAAPADCVWPWLAQMGPAPRGGAYTYDWIENLLGLNMH